MKLKPLIYSISVAVLAAVATAQESLPPEVAAARTRYETDREAAIKPVRQRYVLQLESLKKSAMVRNDLKTINENLESLSGHPFQAIYESFVKAKGIKL